MDKKKLVIFGTGRMYQTNRNLIKDNIQIVAFCDNDSNKWGKTIDGIGVISPEQLTQVDYDYIFILNRYAFEIRKQLVAQNIDMLKVYDLDHFSLLFPIDDIEFFAVSTKCSKKYEVILFTHALSASGANVILLRAALIYRGLGYRVLVISRNDGELRERYTEAGIDIYIFSDLLAASEIWEEFLSATTLVIVNTFWFYYLLQEMDKKYKGKVIWWIHETFPFSAVSRHQFNVCVNGLRAVVAVSPKVDNLIKEMYEYDESIVLPWGIPERRQHVTYDDNKKMVFAMIGSISYEIKGQDVFLKAIELLSERDREESEFWIVGAGELSGVEKEIACRYGCIRIMGFINQDKIPDIYAQSDVIVCASRQEALSVVTVEAFMNEKLAIVSDAAGIVDYMVPGEDGLIFTSGDHVKLAEYMHWAINHADEARAIGQRSRRVYDKYFTMQAFRERLVQLI